VTLDPPRRRVAIVTNIMAPYRTPVLRELASRVDVRVFYAAQTDSNRQWSVAGDLPFSYEILTSRAIEMRGRIIYFAPRLYFRLRAYKPTVVMVGGFSLPTVYVLCYCILSGAKMVIINEGTRHTELGFGRVSRLLRRALLRLASAYVVTSTAAEQRLSDLGANPEHCVIAPYALDVGDRPTRDYSLSGDVARILYVGRFLEPKGVLQLLEAVELIGQGDAVTLTMVGHGPLEEMLRSLVVARRLESQVTVRGFVDQPALPALYAEHDLFIFPTFKDTFGIVLLEAMAAGLPVIASCLAGATSDFVETGKNGWIMQAVTVDEIARTLKSALQARDSWPTLGAASRRHVEAMSPEYAAGKILNALDIAERQDG
jgi:glycosyltransferase involved in cell wall biosynthesis